MTDIVPNESDDTQSHEVLSPDSVVGHYRIIRRLGAGGMGEVYLATDSRLRRQVALKLLPDRFSDDKKLLSRFMVEARAAAALNHPNIVTVHEVARYKGRPYLAMEFVSGETLRDRLHRGPIPFGQALELISQVCQGIREAHESGIVHRDLKPSNVMVDRRGRSVVLDFGLAKVYDDPHHTSPGSVIGTAAYMSPEQARGITVDHRSDIFSLGCVFYEMLTGRSPFRRERTDATVYAVVHDQPECLSRLMDGDTDACQKIIDRMLAKDPLERYQTVADLMADIERLQEGKTLSLPVAGPGESETPDIVGLAVLCLRNLGPVEDEYLSYGITEDLIVDLMRIGTIRVAPMRSVLPFRESDQPLADIARTLDVAMVLDGSIHKTRDKVRASAQLVDIASGRLLWADRWEDSFDRLPLIKRSLADGVSAALNIDASVARAAQVGEPESRNPKAYEYYLRGKYAYEHRHSSSDVKVAAGLYDQALKLEPNLLAAREGAAEILISEGRHDEAAQLLKSSLAEARQRRLRADEAHTLQLLAHCSGLQSQWVEAARYAEAAVEVSRELGDLTGEAAALRELIDALKYRANYKEALRRADRVLHINRQLHDRDKEAEALNLIGTVHLRQYELEKALSLYQEALKIATERDQSSVKAASITNIGSAYFYLGDFDQALLHYEKSLQIFSDLGESTKQAVVAQNLAGIYLTKGDYHKALEMYETALSICEKHNEQAKSVLTQNNISHVLVILGRYDEAIDKLHDVLKLARESGYTLMIGYAHTNLGMAHYCRGDESKAEQELRTAVQVAEEAGLPRVLALALLYWGELGYVFGRCEECFDHFARARDLAEQVGDKQVSLRSRAYLSARPADGPEAADRLRGQREIVDEAEKSGNPAIILAAKRLLAESLLRSGRSSAERKEGIAMLSDLITYAQERQIAYEGEWLRSMRDRLPAGR